jgi:hypothetical protein
MLGLWKVEGRSGKTKFLKRRRGNDLSTYQSILSIYSYPATYKPTKKLTRRFLLSGVIHSNDLALIPFVLRESESPRLLESLDPADLVHRSLESVHPRSIVGQIEFLDFLDVVIVS